MGTSSSNVDINDEASASNKKQKYKHVKRSG